MDPNSIVAAANKDGILSLIYKDLAQPGVRQVGEALKTVIELGSHALLPVRLINETVRKFEQRKFEAIADRFSQIPDEELIEVSPEIGVPILEKLSYTEDETLRQLFVELLGKSATSSKVGLAHPSFVNVISSICPDEAILLKEVKSKKYHPIISVQIQNPKTGGASQVQDIVFLPPEGLIHQDKTPLYISNLVGLGIFEIRRGESLTKDGSYDKIEEYCRKKFKLPDEIEASDEKWKVQYVQHVLSVLPYGESFISACK